MNYEIIGHIFHLAGLFFAFLCVGIMLFFAQFTKGGAFSKSSIYLALGILIIASDFFAIYASAVTGELNMAHLNWIWPLLGIAASVGFGLIAFSAHSFINALGGAR